jgi:hypothetical protein
MKKNAWVKGVITALLLVAVKFNYTGALDVMGQSHINNSFNDASTAFVSGRALNAVISVMQGTELALVPLGIGMTLAPGQILDPVNDLVEQFSWVMLASTTAIGAEKVFMVITAWPVSRVIYSGLLLLTVLFIWTEKVSIKSKSFWLKVSLVVIFLRFSIPFVFIVNAGVYEQFLSAQYNRSFLVIKQTHKNIEDLGQDYQTIALTMQNQQQQHSRSDETLWGRVKNTLDIKAYVQLQIAELKKQLEQQLLQLKTIVNNLAEHLLELIVVFVLHAVIFPVAILYGLYRFTKYILSLDLSVLFVR